MSNLIEELTEGRIIELVLSVREDAGTGKPVPLLLLLEAADGADVETAAAWVAMALTVPHPQNPLNKVNIYGRKEEFGYLTQQDQLSESADLNDEERAFLRAVTAQVFGDPNGNGNGHT